MDRKELLMNDGYWEASIECVFWRHRHTKILRRLFRKALTKEVLKLKNELIKELTNGQEGEDIKT